MDTKFMKENLFKVNGTTRVFCQTSPSQDRRVGTGTEKTEGTEKKEEARIRPIGYVKP